MPVTHGRRRVYGALIAALLIGAMLLAYARPNPFADTFEVRAIVDDAGRIAPVGADVRMAGTPVGRITGRRRIGDDAELTLELRREAGTFRRDATAVLRSRLPFEGTADVDLRPRTPSAPPPRRAPAAVLGPGRPSEGPASVARRPGPPSAPPLGDAPIPRRQTTVAPSLEATLRTLDAPTRRALRGAVAGLNGSLKTDGVHAFLHRAPPLFRDTAWATEAAGGPALRGAGTGVSRTASAAAARERALGPLARGTAATARALRADGRLAVALSRLPAATASLRRTAGALDRSLREVEPFAR